MPDMKLQADITAVDKASPVFAKVASGAEKMGTSVDNASKKAARSTDDLNKRAAALGAAFTAGAALLGQWSRSSEDAAAIQRQLEASIAATGESFDKYAAQIEEVGKRAVQLGQDDEAASQAIAALTQITGSASTALSQMNLVFDLAAAKHLSLENAAELVGKVMEGNTGILARYGIVVEEGASSAEALAQIQQQVAGQAEASATTYARLREELSNLTDSIGGAVGGFAPLLSLLPGVSSGFTLMGSAIGALAPSLTATGVATKAISLAMGPAGLVLAAGAAAVALYEVGKAFDNANLSAKEAASQAKSFEETLARIGKQSGGKAVSSDLVAFRDVLVEIGQKSSDATKAMNEAFRELNRLMQEEQEAQGTGDADALDAAHARTEAQRAYIDSLNETIISEKDLSDLSKDVVDIFTDMNPLNADLVIAKFNELTAQFKAGTLSSDDYIKAIDELNATSDSYGLTLAEIAAGTRIATTQTNAATEATGGLQRALAGLPLDKAAGLMDRLTGTITTTKDATDDLAFAAAGASGSIDSLTSGVGSATKESEAYIVATDSIASSIDGVTSGVGGADSAVKAFTANLIGSENALERIARGGASAAETLQAFKDVQDGIISQQDVFNQQFSEYGSQISAIERAQDILNQRVAEGQKLNDDQLDFLNQAPAALERLTGGQEDAAIAAGELAAQYGENMTVGDQLNSNLGNLDDTVGGLSDSIDALTAALGGVPPKTDAEVSVAGLADNITDAEYMGDLLDTLDGQSATPSVSVAGLGDALSGALALQNAIAGLDGMSAVTNVRNIVTNETNNIVNGANFRHGGIVPHAFARDGLVTRDMMAVTVGEAGRETVFAPGGSYIRNAAATAASGGGRGMSVVFNIARVDAANFDEFLTEAERLVRARFAGLGL